jgi:hypothetical protein
MAVNAARPLLVVPVRPSPGPGPDGDARAAGRARDRPVTVRTEDPATY